MQPETATVDLNDRVEEIDEAIADLEERLADIEAEAEGLDREEDSADAERFDELQADYAEAKQRRQELEHARETLRECVREWNGSEFQIREFSWGRQAQRNDLVAGDMLQSEYDDPEANAGALKIRTVQVGVVSTPPDAPSNPREWPPVVGEYLYQRIDALNTVGEAILDDFSLSAALDGEN